MDSFSFIEGSAGAFTAVTPPGNITLARTLPATTSTSALVFNVTGANSALTCATTSAGYSVAPAPLNLVAGTPGTVTVTHTGSTAGSFPGVVTCTGAVGSTGGPFVYNYTTTVSAPVITAVTAPGVVTLPNYTLPTGSSATTLNFNIAGANGAVACVAGGAGYTATPNPLNLVVGTAGGVTVTYTGAAAGTFPGTLVCTPVAPATGGPFNYTLSTTVNVLITVTTPPTPVSGSTISLPEFVVGGGNNGSSSATLNFGIISGTAQLACVASGAGYTATPNPLSLTAAGPNVVRVTYTGNVAGTFLGTVVCTPVAPATGGPFTYNFRAFVAAPTIPVPTLGNISLMLLIAGFLGLGMVLVGRRQA